MALRASLAEPHSSRRGKPLRLRRLGPPPRAGQRLIPRPLRASPSSQCSLVLSLRLGRTFFCLSSPPRLTHEGRSALLKRKRRPVQREHMLNRAPGPPRIASTPKGDTFGVEKRVSATEDHGPDRAHHRPGPRWDFQMPIAAPNSALIVSRRSRACDQGTGAPSSTGRITSR